MSHTIPYPISDCNRHISAFLCELNTGTLTLRNGIANNSDANNIIATGIYELYYSAAQTVVNFAFNSSSILEVISGLGYVIQRQTGIDKCFVRYRDSNLKWFDWQEITPGINGKELLKPIAGVEITKKGPLVEISITKTDAAYWTNEQTLFTLPERFRPLNLVSAVIKNSADDVSGTIRIHTNGPVIIYINTPGRYIYGDTMYFSAIS